MKQIFIVFGILFIGIYSFGKYQDYQRFNSDSILYKTEQKINENHYDQEVVLSYRKAIETVNGFVKLQWFTKEIDVLNPENDNEETKDAVNTYHSKLARLKFYEAKLIQSFELKQKGLPEEEIKAVFESKLSPSKIAEKEQKNLLRKLFQKFNSHAYGAKSVKSEVIFEVQKLLVSKGYPITVDGLSRKETQEAIKDFEIKNNFFPDGKIDILTFEALLK